MTPRPHDPQAIARGWIEVARLVERERRREAGEPLIQLVPSRRALNTDEDGGEGE